MSSHWEIFGSDPNRRLSFSSPSSSPSQSQSPSRKPPLPPRRSPQKRSEAAAAAAALSPIAEDDGPGERATPSPTPMCVAPPSASPKRSRAPRTPATAGRMRVDTPPPSSRAPHTPTTTSHPPSPALHPQPQATRPMSQAYPAASVSASPQQQLAVPVSAVLRELERRREAADAALRQMQLQVWAAEVARQQQSQELRLYTVEGNATGYGTNWAELHPQSQELLLHIENKMREYKHESDLLDQCSRLYDPSLSNRSFELFSTEISQEIGSTSTIMDKEMASIQSLMAVVKEMMWNTDSAIHSYIKLRPNFIYRYPGTAETGFAHRAGPSGAPTDFSQSSATAPTFDFYSGAAMRPSPFMQNTVSKFENHLEECSRMVGELEQLIQINNDKNHSNASESLSILVPNVCDYFIHVASQVENLHQNAEIMRTHYRNVWRLLGNCSDPFQEADRREAAKQEAVARVVHPTGVDVSTLASQPWQSSSPTGATSSSTRAVLRTPLSALPWSSIRTSPAPSPRPFSSSGSMLQPMPFGSASTLALGSTPAASSASFSALGGTSLFRTPPGENGDAPKR